VAHPLTGGAVKLKPEGDKMNTKWQHWNKPRAFNVFSQPSVKASISLLRGSPELESNLCPIQHLRMVLGWSRKLSSITAEIFINTCRLGRLRFPALWLSLGCTISVAVSISTANSQGHISLQRDGRLLSLVNY